MSPDQGWADMPGGGLLGKLIADAFGRAAASDPASAPTAAPADDEPA